MAISVVLRVFCVGLVVFFACFSVACHVRHIDPYSGEEDPDRHFRSQGVVATLFNMFVSGVKKPEHTDAYSVTDQGQRVWECAPDHLVNWSLLDQVTKELRTAYESSGMVLYRADDRLLMLVPSTWYDAGQAHLVPAYYPALDGLSAYWGQNAGVRIDLVGLVSAPIEVTLAMSRAVHIERYLNKHGVAPYRTLVRQPSNQWSGSEFAVALLVCTLPSGYQENRAESASSLKRALFN